MNAFLNFQWNNQKYVLDHKKGAAIHSNDIIESDDIRLWQEFQSGNEDAYASIYRNYVGMMYKYGMRLVSDNEMVKDCIQDLFVEIWNSKQRLGKVKSIKSYLFRSIRRKLIFEAKKSRRRHAADSSSLLVLNSPPTPSFERNLIEKQIFDNQREILKKALDKLTDRQKEIIHLKFYALLNYKEIAEVMSLSIKGTYKLMARSIDSLKENFSVLLIIVPTLF